MSASDLSYRGGKLEFDNYGELVLGGDPGISAGIKDELEAITGMPRIIPIYRRLAGGGDNAAFTIVKFVGIRIMEVQLNGDAKQLIVQPANVITRGTIPTKTGGTSDHVFSPAYLVN